MASLNKRGFSSAPPQRILQLAQPRETKSVWLTTPEKLMWGNQETIWPRSWAALKAVPTARIEALSQPKKDFLALHQEQLRLAYEERDGGLRRSAGLPSSSEQYEHVRRLATPKSRFGSSCEVRPPHTVWCEHNCPVWHISPAVCHAVASPRVVQLARPKVLHPDYRSNRQTAESCISRAARSAQPSARLEQLCAPKLNASSLFYQYGPPESPIRPVRKKHLCFERSKKSHSQRSCERALQPKVPQEGTLTTGLRE